MEGHRRGVSRRRQRTIIDDHQKNVLIKAFELYGGYPDTSVRDALSQKLGLSLQCLTIWFQNRRAKAKQKLDKQRPDTTLEQISSGPFQYNWFGNTSGMSVAHATRRHPDSSNQTARQSFPPLPSSWSSVNGFYQSNQFRERKEEDKKATFSNSNETGHLNIGDSRITAAPPMNNALAPVKRKSEKASMEKTLAQGIGKSETASLDNVLAKGKGKTGKVSTENLLARGKGTADVELLGNVLLQSRGTNEMHGQPNDAKDKESKSNFDSVSTGNLASFNNSGMPSNVSGSSPQTSSNNRFAQIAPRPLQQKHLLQQNQMPKPKQIVKQGQRDEQAQRSLNERLNSQIQKDQPFQQNQPLHHDQLAQSVQPVMRDQPPTLNQRLQENQHLQKDQRILSVAQDDARYGSSETLANHRQQFTFRETTKEHMSVHDHRLLQDQQVVKDMLFMTDQQSRGNRQSNQLCQKQSKRMKSGLHKEQTNPGRLGLRKILPKLPETLTTMPSQDENTIKQTDSTQVNQNNFGIARILGTESLNSDHKKESPGKGSADSMCQIDQGLRVQESEPNTKSKINSENNIPISYKPGDTKSNHGEEILIDMNSREASESGEMNSSAGEVTLTKVWSSGDAAKTVKSQPNTRCDNVCVVTPTIQTSTVSQSVIKTLQGSTGSVGSLSQDSLKFSDIKGSFEAEPERNEILPSSEISFDLPRVSTEQDKAGSRKKVKVVKRTDSVGLSCSKVYLKPKDIEEPVSATKKIDTRAGPVNSQTSIVRSFGEKHKISHKRRKSMIVSGRPQKVSCLKPDEKLLNRSFSPSKYLIRQRSTARISYHASPEVTKSLSEMYERKERKVVIIDLFPEHTKHTGPEGIVELDKKIHPEHSKQRDKVLSYSKNKSPFNKVNFQDVTDRRHHPQNKEHFTIHDENERIDTLPLMITNVTSLSETANQLWSKTTIDEDTDLTDDKNQGTVEDPEQPMDLSTCSSINTDVLSRHTTNSNGVSQLSAEPKLGSSSKAHPKERSVGHGYKKSVDVSTKVKDQADNDKHLGTVGGLEQAMDLRKCQTIPSDRYNGGIRVPTDPKLDPYTNLNLMKHSQGHDKKATVYVYHTSSEIDFSSNTINEANNRRANDRKGRTKDVSYTQTAAVTSCNTIDETNNIGAHDASTQHSQTGQFKNQRNLWCLPVHNEVSCKLKPEDMEDKSIPDDDQSVQTDPSSATRVGAYVQDDDCKMNGNENNRLSIHKHPEDISNDNISCSSDLSAMMFSYQHDDNQHRIDKEAQRTGESDTTEDETLEEDTMSVLVRDADADADASLTSGATLSELGPNDINTTNKQSREPCLLNVNSQSSDLVNFGAQYHDLTSSTTEETSDSGLDTPNNEVLTEKCVWIPPCLRC